MGIKLAEYGKINERKDTKIVLPVLFSMAIVSEFCVLCQLPHIVENVWRKNNKNQRKILWGKSIIF